MSPQTWTIDSIAHALPHPELRQTFMREVNLTPLPDLPAVLDKWERFVVQWRDETVPKVEAVREYMREHDGELPPEYQETPESRASFDEWRERLTADTKRHNAA